MRLVGILTFLTVMNSCYAQLYRQANIWFTWDQVGLNFNSLPPKAEINTTSSINGLARATICTRQGRMLFYSDGNKVWDSTYAVMPGGENLGGDYATLSLIANKPGSDVIFYLFNLDPVKNVFSYSVIDMTRNGGHGEVVSKNLVIDSDIRTNYFAATLHKNGSDYWLIYMNGNQDAIYSYHVSKNGVDVTPVISMRNVIGRVFSPMYWIKASIDHRYVAVNGTSGKTYILRFNNANGTLSFFDTIHSSLRDIEFSPNCRFLYHVNENDDIEQYDLSVYPQPISKTKYTIVNTTGDLNLEGIQLGPDKKIYIAATGGTHLHVINQPNNKGAQCGFIPNAIYLKGKRTAFELPIWLYKPMVIIDHRCKGDTTTFQYSKDAIYADSMLWDFNDPASLQSNQSKDPNPKHVFSDTGLYAVRLIAYLPSASTDTSYYEVHITKPHFTLGPDTTICEHDQVLFFPKKVSGYRPYAYLWQDSSEGTSFRTSRNEKTVVLKLTDANECSTLDTVKISYKKLPVFSVGNDTVYCGIKQATLRVKLLNAAFKWNTGDTGDHIVVVASGRYFVTATQDGCSFTDSINLRLVNYPVVDLGPDDSICGQFEKRIDLRGVAETYLWSTGSTSPVQIISSPGVYILKAANAGCSSFDTLNINVRSRFNLFTPTAFTPNNNGLNDMFRPVTDLSKYQLSIYSGWGELLYQGNTGWDGSYKMAFCPAGVYLYVIQFADCHNISHIQRGTVTLVQ